jgi:hypothetical protein
VAFGITSWDSSPLPLLFVSVASKRLTIPLNPLFATHTRVRRSVASKGLALQQNGAEKAASVFGDAAKSAPGRLIGVAASSSCRRVARPWLTVNKYYVLDIIRMTLGLEVGDSRGDSARCWSNVELGSLHRAWARVGRGARVFLLTFS